MAQRWVIPDIHGCVKTLDSLLQQIQPKKTDHLIFLGDYVDRGPDSKGLIDLIMDLEENGYTLTTLRGNHEEFFLDSIKAESKVKRSFFFTEKNTEKAQWFRFGGRDTVKSFGVKDLRNIPEKYIDWLKKLPYYLELEDYVIVHAALNFNIDNPFEDTHTMLWEKEFEVDRSKIGGRKLIHGHTPVSHEFIYECVNSDNFDFIDLDNGVYMVGRRGFGNLMALELNTKTLMVQPCLDL